MYYPNHYPNRNNSQYLFFEGTVADLSNIGDDGCTKMMMVRGVYKDIVNFVIQPDTYIIDQTKIKAGMPVKAFYDANAPAVLIYPPQYNAVVIAANVAQNVVVDWFDKNLINKGQTLKLNISPKTEIVLENGQEFTGSLGNRNLIVMYSATTRSIPAQTTPDKIIVLCQ